MPEPPVWRVGAGGWQDHEGTPHAGPANAVTSPRCAPSGRDVWARRASGSITHDKAVGSVDCRPQIEGCGVPTPHRGAFQYGDQLGQLLARQIGGAPRLFCL